ncbi:ABC transporter ATP-binding protein [Staphylococcus sp. IVB6214]|uniref:ABC transporter ATP-binding protein n=1 Tax=Staphylococcus sp. IVB6214 TaxID=2989766 RepID=UPI0021D1688A|nr:ABC transporter ATP-binding protein [Staphylococcus sp. IVB6214]UXR82406.1 ABC transporter ATP-binding protein [Staphylococcus sp. IVB6214]
MLNVIETQNVSKRFGDFQVVQDLNIQIPEGTICGFLGPNGSGKTTTIRMLLGLAKPTEGHVKIFNMPLENHKQDILNQVGALVDSPSFYDHLTGYENLKIMQYVHHNSDKTIEEVLGIVELTHAANKKVKDYSLGMKQRLGIAIALMNDPKLIILDEPTNGLDPSGIKKMRELLMKLVKDRGISIIVSSHNLFEIEQMCRYVCVINKGQLLYQGDMHTLLEKYKHDYIYFVTDDNTKAQSLLADVDISIEDQRLTVKAHRDEIPQINKMLVKHDINVYEIYHEKSSLEDIFLKLTKNVDERDYADE